MNQSCFVIWPLLDINRAEVFVLSERGISTIFFSKSETIGIRKKREEQRETETEKETRLVAWSRVNNRITVRAH